jgi:prepilin-type processing-associated H-X9-DG protein
MGEGIYDNPANVAAASLHNWAEYILPFVDQGPLYNQINFDGPMGFGSATGGPINVSSVPGLSAAPAYQQPYAAIASAVIGSYICPSTPRGSNMYNYINDWMYGSFSSMSMYNIGSACDYMPPADMWGSWPKPPVPGDPQMIMSLGDDPWYLCSSIGSVTDGTSNTIFNMEVADGSNQWAMGKNLGGNKQVGSSPSGSVFAGTWTDFTIGLFAVRPLAPGANANNKPAGQCVINCTNQWNAYSFHPGGAHIALADGSVRFISQNINYMNFAWLMIKNDGFAVGDF